jgi:endonuclease/exonuclease/phosphatase family metal-dependent hydrolase
VHDRIGGMVRMRLMTYNIYLAGRRGAPLHEVVRSVAPDVLLVNESPHYPWVWRRQCRALAEQWRLRLVTGGRPAGSLMVLTRDGVKADVLRRKVLGRPPFRPRRGIVAAQLEVEGRPVGLVGCHLSLHPRQRLREGGQVLTSAEGLRGPGVVAGDLNEPPGGPSWARLHAAGFVDHGDRGWLTFPAERPAKRIDAVLVRGDVAVHHHGDPGVAEELLARASDHRPVLAVLDV